MERISTPFSVRSRSVRSRLMFVTRGEHLSQTEAALFKLPATMAAIPAGSEIALALLITSSKPQVRDSQRPKADLVLPATTTLPLIIQP